MRGLVVVENFVVQGATLTTGSPVSVRLFGDHVNSQNPKIS